MARIKLTCKKCGGFMYEEEVYYDQNGIKTMQVGCYGCAHKGYIEYKKWLEFKNKLSKACVSNAQ